MTIKSVVPFRAILNPKTLKNKLLNQINKKKFICDVA